MRRQTNVLLASDLAWWRPTPAVFSDREDGTLYMLTFSVDDDEVELTSTIPTSVAYVAREPQLEASGFYVRLYVSDGVLRYEEVDEGNELDEGPVLSLNTAHPRTTYQVYAGACLATFGDPVGLIKYEGLGTADVTITDLGCVQFLVSASDVFEDGVFVEGVFV